MATYIPAPVDPLGLAFRGVGPNIAQGKILGLQREDQQAYADWLMGNYPYMTGQAIGPVAPMPDFRFPQTQQMALNAYTQLQDPLRRAQLLETTARARLLGSQADEALAGPTEEEILDLNIKRAKAQAPFGMERIENPETGEWGWMPVGQAPPEGFVSADTGSLVTVNTGDIEKSTKGSLERDIVDLEQRVVGLDNVMNQFRPEFATIPGRMKARTTAAAERLGKTANEFLKQLPVVGDVLDKQFLEDYTTWFSQAKNEILAFRKWATGVAGGPKEFAEIYKGYADPEKDSPTQFQSKAAAIREHAKRLQRTFSAMRDAGVDVTPEIAKSVMKSTAPNLQETTGPSLERTPSRSEQSGQSSGEQQIKDGTVIEGPTGTRHVMRNGKWHPPISQFRQGSR